MSGLTLLLSNTARCSTAGLVDCADAGREFVRGRPVVFGFAHPRQVFGLAGADANFVQLFVVAFTSTSGFDVVVEGTDS